MSLIVVDCEVRAASQTRPDARHVCRGNSCSVLSKTVVCLYSFDRENANSASYFCANPGINLITLICAPCHVPTVCLHWKNRTSLVSQDKGGGEEKCFICAGEKKSLWVDYASPTDDITKSAWTGERGECGCKEDEIQAVCGGKCLLNAKGYGSMLG